MGEERAMATAVVTSKGQITIPIEIRKKIHLETGDRVEFVENEEGQILLIPATTDIRRLKGAAGDPSKAVSLEEMDRSIRRRGSR